VISDDHCGRDLDLAEPAVGRRVGPLVIAEPEVGICCPADLGLRGLVGTGGCPGPQAESGDRVPVPGREELVELLAIGIIERPWIVRNRECRTG
jgi:hypothetical protein